LRTLSYPARATSAEGRCAKEAREVDQAPFELGCGADMAEGELVLDRPPDHRSLQAVVEEREVMVSVLPRNETALYKCIDQRRKIARRRPHAERKLIRG
jgi:hypothetical protein